MHSWSGWIEEIEESFINEMLDHIAWEDNGIFPTCERALPDAEKQTVIVRMEAIRQKAKEMPTPSITSLERTFNGYQADL